MAINKERLKKIALLPNVITAFGLSCGLFVIFKMSLIAHEKVDEAVLTSLVAIILLAAFADLLDGAIARAIKAESEFGGIFDSLADAISFGVAPSIIALKALSVTPGTKLAFFTMLAALIFSLCGVLRLVRFSVNALHAKEEAILNLGDKKHFTGLPIPAAAGAAISLTLLLFSHDLQACCSLSETARAFILSTGLFFLGYCMVSRWKFPSVKSLEIRVSSFQTIFWTVLSAVFIFFGILHYFAIVFFTICWGYVFIALTFAIIRKIAGRKSKTLEEFEPEPEDEEELDV